MSRQARRFWPFAAAGVIAVSTAAGLAVVWRSPHRADLESFAGLVIPVAGIAAGWIVWVWRYKSSPVDGVVSRQELARLTELLAGAAREEWTRAAGERGLLEPEPIPVRWRRPAVPITGPVAAAVASTRFAPLPGLTAAREQRLQEGQVSELHEVYGGLGSGRLIIVGAPGAGKSSAAVLLILAALRYRRSLPEDARSEVPVPVMFTLHGWDPGTQRAPDWLAERLWQTYPLFGGRQGVGTARAMLAEGRISAILDGLDEIPEDLRPAALRALSQQATFRLVLLTRSAEMADAAAHAVLQGAAAVELQDIDPRTAAGYLIRTQLDPPPQGWDELTSRLRQKPGSPLAQALNNPLMLTLIRDTYRATDDISELLRLRDAAGRPASSADFTAALLDRVLPAAYTQQPGEPPTRYNLATAERALRRIATRMNKDGTRDLQWWQVPAWTHPAPRIITTWLGAMIVAGLAAGLAVGLPFGFANGLPAAIALGLLAGTAAGVTFGRGKKIPKRLAPLRWQQLFRLRQLVVGSLAGLVAGIAVWWLFRLTPQGIEAGVLAGLVIGILAWLEAGFVAGMSRPGTDNASPRDPRSSWRSDQAFGLVTGLMVWLGIGLAVGLVIAIESMTWAPIVVCLLAGLVTGLPVGLVYPQSWASALAFVQISVSDRTPIRLIRFLEDARRRGVLRTVGPVYQFRHARLQDRLTAGLSTTGPVPDEPRPTAPEVAVPTGEAPPAGVL